MLLDYLDEMIDQTLARDCVST